MNEHHSTATALSDDDLFQFQNMVGDIADRIRTLPGKSVDSKDVTFVACVLVGDFPTEALFRADYDGIPNEKDETLLRDALKNLEDILPEPFKYSETEKGHVKFQRQPPKRKSQKGHFNYADIPGGVIVISHKATRIRRLLSNNERDAVTDYYIHNMLDDVCNCCRQKMAEEGKTSSFEGHHDDE